MTVENNNAAPTIELSGLFEMARNHDSLTWDYFRDGVDIHRLYGDGRVGPSAALLHYRETMPIPPHVHEGYEHILVLVGCQEDADGRVEAGSLRIHPPGTEHHGMGYAGCVLLAIYEKPVRFL